MAEIIVNGLRIGSLIKVCGLSDAQLNELGKSVDGQVGQIVSFDAASGQVQVCLLSGVSCLLDPKKPGSCN